MWQAWRTTSSISVRSSATSELTGEKDRGKLLARHPQVVAAYITAAATDFQTVARLGMIDAVGNLGGRSHYWGWALVKP